MFDSLFKLYRNNSRKTPLEDFTTEGFAGILQMHPKIGLDFCSNFLKLPKDNYSVYTQYKVAIKTDDPNCIVDLVLIGENNICFIENKVESSEGYKQLERYIIALKEHRPKKERHLRYCTKYADPKTIEDNQISFNQFRWYEIAKFLEIYTNHPLVKSYLEFLTKHKMAQDNTIKSDNLIAMESMRKTVEIVEFHVDNSKHYFKELFGGSKVDRNFNWAQIKRHSRICYYVDKILPSTTVKWSEILYAIEFNNLKMIAQIFIEEGHEKTEAFNEIVLFDNFIKIESDLGIAIQLNEDLGKYLNNENADKLIQKWFHDSFKKLNELILQNDTLGWQIKKK